MMDMYGCVHSHLRGYEIHVHDVLSLYTVCVVHFILLVYTHVTVYINLPKCLRRGIGFVERIL